MKIRDKKGFISTVVIYSLFIMFLGTLLVLINSYSNNRLIIENEKTPLMDNLDNNYKHPIHYHVGDPMLGTGCYTKPVRCKDKPNNSTCYEGVKCGGYYASHSYKNTCNGFFRKNGTPYYVNNPVGAHWSVQVRCDRCGKIEYHGCDSAGNANFGQCSRVISSGSYTQCTRCGAKHGSGTCNRITSYRLKSGFTADTIMYYDLGCGYKEGEEEH